MLNDPQMRAMMGLPPTSATTGIQWTGSTDIMGVKNGFGKEILPSGNYEEGIYKDGKKIGKWRTCLPNGLAISIADYDNYGALIGAQNVAMPPPAYPPPVYGQSFPAYYPPPAQAGFGVTFQVPPGQ